MDLMERERPGIQRQSYRIRRCWSKGTGVRKKARSVLRTRAQKAVSMVVLPGLPVSNIGAWKVVCKLVGQAPRIEA